MVKQKRHEIENLDPESLKLLNQKAKKLGITTDELCERIVAERLRELKEKYEK